MKLNFKQQDLLEHQHRLEEEEATRKRDDRLEQDKKSSKDKFEEVGKKTYSIQKLYFYNYRLFEIGKGREQKKFQENYTK